MLFTAVVYLYVLSVGSSENRQSAQLEILYKARGRHLEQVQRDLQVLREESDREIRVLKHKLALLQGKCYNK